MRRTSRDGGARATLSDLRRRIYLTYRYHGLGAVLYRAITFPLRFTPLGDRLLLGRTGLGELAQATAWYRRNGRPVSIVIPSYRDAEHLARLVAAIRRTTQRARVRIIVADDASGPEHLAALRRLGGIELIAGETNAGFAGNVNRALRAAGSQRDVVLLNSDVIPHRGWLAALQHATHRWSNVGLVGARLLYPDGRIQYAGMVRNLGAPEWFDHRHRFRPADYGPANVPAPTLAVTGACMYITQAALQRVGEFDERYPMAFEDVDYSLRVWQAALQVVYQPAAVLTHLESVTRGTQLGERELASQRAFWSRWAALLDRREVRTAEGLLRVIYVTEDTGVGGGHRDIFEHLNRLADRGHQVELWTLGDRPDWFKLRVPVRCFADYEQLQTALAPIDAIKVATWWRTADAVWRASVLHGIPVYFVQDIETSYYPQDPAMRDAVLESYRHEFRYMTISSWNRERLRELRLDAQLIPPGIDLETFRPLADVTRREDVVLALGRSHPLKNFKLTLEAWRALPEPRPQLWLFGIEPELAAGQPGIRYIVRPSDEEVNRLFNQATVFVQTSIHEGFCLPALEAMATGGAVVCTDAHGNRDFCRDGENCLLAESTVEAVAQAIARLLGDASLRLRIGQAGRKTAAEYSWDRRIDALERFLQQVAQPGQLALSAQTAAGDAKRRAPSP
jgi:GT2 family glycosyltransferase